ncbi:MAG: hypothetical protein MUC29_04765 [Pyrinomonadaceae bacterium]|nr:hypothetical protein [Pyrinomonadaceae bacterium]
MQFIASLFLVGVFLSSQENLLPQYDQPITNNIVQTTTVETERFEQSYPFSSNGKIGVSNVNGSITVEAWDKNEIKFEYTKTADSAERLKELEVKIDASRDSFRVSTEYDQVKRKEGYYTGDKYYRLQVDFRLFVPRNAFLDVIETVNGSVSISKMNNSVIAKAVNGSVKGFNLRGTAKLTTVNGTSEASFDEVENNGVISIETVNGNAILTIPSDAEATILAETLNGNITNDFGMVVKKGEYVGKDLHSRLGNGTNKIKLNSVNGGLTIRRKNDGKQVKSITNLLSSSKDEDEDTYSNYPNVVVPPIPPVNVVVPPINVRVPPIAISPMNINIPQIEMNFPEFAVDINDADAKVAIEEYKMAVKSYDDAIKSAQTRLNQAQKEFNEQTKDYQLALKEAQKNLEQSRKNNSSPNSEEYKEALAEYEEAINDAKENLAERDKDYQNALKDYNLLIKEAKAELKQAQKEYQKAISKSDKANKDKTQGYSYSYSTDWDYATASIDKKSDSFGVKGVPNVSLNTPNCAVTVRGWDKPEISYTITKISKNQNQLPIEFEVEKNENGLSIVSVNKNAVRTNKSNTNLTVNGGTNNLTINNQKGNVTINGVTYPKSESLVRLEIFVPKKTNLKITSNEEIRLEGVSGNLEIFGDDESINVRDSEGTLKLSNADGRVRVIGFKGELDAATADGQVFLEGDFSKINAKAEDGSYTLTLSENTNADITSNLEEVKLGEANVKINNVLKIGKGGAKYNFLLQDGKIFLRQPNSLKQ